MSAPLLEISGFDACRGRGVVGRVVVAGATFSVGAGEIVALTGMNGAGKSTLLGGLMGLLPHRADALRLAGRDLLPLSPEARAAAGIGWCPEGRRVFPGLTVAETLDAVGPSARTERRARAAHCLALLPELVPHRNRPAWMLSGGQQQMLSIARALMLAPRLLLLDEPALGLAPALVERLAGIVKDLSVQGMAILLADQPGAHLTAIAGRVLALADGGVAEQRGLAPRALAD